MVSGIYSIINKKNGKIYIGQSKNIPNRFTKHKTHLKGNYHTNEHLQRAWNKYGADAFEFQIEKVCKLRYLDRFEKLLIKSYRSDDPSNGYNAESGGNKHKSLSQSTKEKLRNINLGKTLSEDTKKKISASLKGRESPMKGRKHSLESRKKMSDSHKGLFVKENNYQWKNYARIIKEGRTKAGTQVYCIRYDGKRLKRLTNVDNLVKWFEKNYPNEEIRVDI